MPEASRFPPELPVVHATRALIARSRLLLHETDGLVCPPLRAHPTVLWALSSVALLDTSAAGTGEASPGWHDYLALEAALAYAVSAAPYDLLPAAQRVAGLLVALRNAQDPAGAMAEVAAFPDAVEVMLVLANLQRIRRH